jgi:colicin import membrane protein
MSRMLRHVGLVLWLAFGAAQAEDQAADERAAIRNERAEVETRFRWAEADCRQRFAVSGCLAEAEAQKRTALDGLRRRELVLDDAQRKAEAEANAKRLQTKRAEAEARPAPVPRPAPGASAAAARPSGSTAAAAREPKRSKTADDPVEAAERAAAQQRRLAEAEERRQKAEQRNAERAAKGKKSSPLPLPGAASAAPPG